MRGRLTSPRVPRAFVTVLAAVMTVRASLTVLEAQGRIANAPIETRQTTAPLAREVESIANRGVATWIGYRVPMLPGQRRLCCYDTIAPAGGGACRLESGGGITMTQNDASSRGSSVVVEPASDLVILARVEARAIVRLRTFTPDCDIDGGAMPIVWFDNVAPADSIAWLTTLVRGNVSDERVVQPAIGALALHPGDTATRTLIGLARDDQRMNVRKQSLFWLAQRAGQDAIATIANAVTNDPETEVKRRAVFALSQLPKDDGIPLLINVARTNRNVEVRRQAMFWLGQTNDPRAVSFFEEILRAK